MVLDYHCADAVKPDVSFSLNDFLKEYALLRRNLKHAFSSRKSTDYDRLSLQNHVTEMKCFVLESGACRATELLSRYEASLSIGDDSTCNRLERGILNELDIFREVKLSLFC